MTNLRRDIETYTCGEVPAMADAPRLEKWSVEIARKKKDFAMVLMGAVHDRPGFADGDLIQTSEIIWFDRKHRFVRTLNTLYALGEKAMT